MSDARDETIEDHEGNELAADLVRAVVHAATTDGMVSTETPDRLIKHMATREAELREARAEIERLREALEQISGTTMSMVLDASHGMIKCKTIAYEAIHGPHTEGEA